MKKIFGLLILVLWLNTSCQSQTQNKPTQLVGGPCEGCEAIYEYGDQILSAIDTLPLFDEHNPKLKVTGTVFKKDGKTPYSDVILYVYQTNRDGLYETKGDEEGWAKRHGFIRGWVKTDDHGRYTIYTFRPASYPDRSQPEHIHITVKEPLINEYYIDSFVFDDDPLLTQKERDRLPNRAGSGIVSPRQENGLLVIERDIILGLNIPDYE